jgi:tetratricopeptide (TPR) repeat protein
MFPYATGQGVEVGHGWKTPYFYVKNDQLSIEGGSLVGGWPLMPMNGFNPFILNDNYFQTYNQINLINSDRKKASEYIETIVSTHQFKEPIVSHVIDKRTQIVEPSNFNNTAWKFFNQGKYQEAIYWASLVIRDERWVQLAKNEQRLKNQRIGGIIDYPWGRTFKNNESPLHLEIWKYPMLNEVATAMWLLANSNYEIGNKEEAKRWVKRIITEVPDHQIAHIITNPNTGKNDLIDGYWNAISSWVNNPSNSERDQAMDKLIVEMGINVTTPPIVIMGPNEFSRSFQ